MTAETLQLRSQLHELLRSSNYESVDSFSVKVNSFFPVDTEHKVIIDQVIKDHLLEIITHANNELLEKYVTFTIEACRKDLCSPTLPAVLLGDILDISTLEKCEQLFGIVESNVSVWKENLFFSVCKNNILRMCNDLLRRLSRSQNTIFCGRILLFLAKFFPFSERSGLNVVSEFNLENITEFGSNIDIDVLISNDDTAFSEKKDAKMKLDYTIYSKFWSLQDYFRCPNNCYIKPKWNLFCAYTDTILSTFSHYKVDHMSDKNKSKESTIGNEMQQQHYFAKFLTNEKLLALQLGDVNVRRCVLIQFLILFQYLKAPVKFKQGNYEFRPEQIQWLENTEKRVYKLMEETPPNGGEFTKVVQHMLQREEYWNSWKNDGCPEIKHPSVAGPKTEYTRQNKTFGEFMKEVATLKRYNLGNKQLNKLWNICPNNLEACRAPNRNFLPTLEDYFGDVVMEANPENEIEQQYKKVNSNDFTWRGLRLLARKSPYFFSQNNAMSSKTSEYIEGMVHKFLKVKPTHTASGTTSVEQKVDVVDQDHQDDFINDEEGESISSHMDYAAYSKPAESGRKAVTLEQLDDVAAMIVDDWKKVAVKIGYQQDEIEFFVTEQPTDEKRARYLLQVWSEDSDDPSPENLAHILEDLDMFNAASILKPKFK